MSTITKLRDHNVISIATVPHGSELRIVRKDKSNWKKHKRTSQDHS
jgi:hypothetical protein